MQGWGWGGEFRLASDPGKVTAVRTSSRAEDGARSGRKGGSSSWQPEGLFLDEGMEPGGCPGGHGI